MLQLQGQTPAPAETQLHASTLLTWGGRGVSWINREGSAGWQEECQRCWQLGRRHRSLWSTAATSILPTIGSTFTLLCECVCTFAPSSALRSSRYLFRCVPEHLSSVVLMSTLRQKYSLPKDFFSCSFTSSFFHLRSDPCFDECMSALVHTLCSFNLLDFEVTGGD